MAQVPTPEFVLRSGGGGCCALAFLQQGSAMEGLLASGASSGLVQLWSLRSRRSLASYAASPESHSIAANALALLSLQELPSGLLMGHCRGGRVLLWDLERAQPLQQLETSSTYPTAMAPALAPLLDLRTRVVSFAAAAVLPGLHCSPPRPPTGASVAASALQESPCIAMAHADGKNLALWDLRAGECQAVIDAGCSDSGQSRGMIMCIQTISDRLLAASFEDGSLSFFDIETRKEVKQLRRSFLSHPALTIACNGRNGLIAGAGSDIVAFQMSLSDHTLNETERFEGCGGSKPGVAMLAVREGGRAGLVAAACWDRRVRLWHVPRLEKARSRPARPLAVLKFHSDTVAAVAWAKEVPRRLASSAPDGKIAVWRLFAEE